MPSKNSSSSHQTLNSNSRDSDLGKQDKGQQIHHQQPSLTLDCCTSCGTTDSWRWFDTPAYGQECNQCYRHFQRRGQRRCTDMQLLHAQRELRQLPLEHDSLTLSDPLVNSTAQALMALSDSEPVVSAPRSFAVDHPPEIDPNLGLMMTPCNTNYFMQRPYHQFSADVGQSGVYSQVLHEQQIRKLAEFNAPLSPRSPTMSPITPPPKTAPWMVKTTEEQYQSRPQLPRHESLLANSSSTKPLEVSDSAEQSVLANNNNTVRGRRGRRGRGGRGAARRQNRQGLAIATPSAFQNESLNHHTAKIGSATTMSIERSEGMRTSSNPASAESPFTATTSIGSPARVYLNLRVVPSLLTGMKWLAVNEPDRPLEWLSRFFSEQSATLEGRAPDSE